MERTNSLTSLSHSIDDLTVSTDGDMTRNKVLPSNGSISGGTTSSALGTVNNNNGTNGLAIPNTNNTLGGGLPAGLIRRVSVRDFDEVSVTSSITAVSGIDTDNNTISSNNRPPARSGSLSGAGQQGSVMTFPGQPPIPIPISSHQLSPNGPGVMIGSPIQSPQFIPMTAYPMMIPHPGSVGIALGTSPSNMMYPASPYSYDGDMTIENHSSSSSTVPLPLPSLDLFKDHILHMKDQMFEKVHSQHQQHASPSTNPNNPHSTFIKNANRIDKLSSLVVSSYQTLLSQMTRYEELIHANSESNTNGQVNQIALSPEENRGRSRSTSAPRTTMKSPSTIKSNSSMDGRRSLSPRPSTSSEPLQSDSGNHAFPSKRAATPQRASTIHGLPEPRRQPEKSTTPSAPKVTRNPTVGNYMSPTALEKIRKSAPAVPKKETIANEPPNFKTFMAESPFDKPLPPTKRRSTSPNAGGRFQPSSSSGLYDRSSPPRSGRDEVKSTSGSTKGVRSSSASAASRRSSTSPAPSSRQPRSTSTPRPLPENSGLLRRTASFNSSMRLQPSAGRGTANSPSKRAPSNTRTPNRPTQSAQERAEKLKRLADSLPATQRLKSDTRGRLNKSTASTQAKAANHGPTPSPAKQSQVGTPGHRILSVEEVLNQVNSRRNSTGTASTATPSVASKRTSSTSNGVTKSPNTIVPTSKTTKSPQSRAMQGASGRRNNTKGATPSTTTTAKTTPSKTSSRAEPRQVYTPIGSTPQSRLTSTSSRTPVASTPSNPSVEMSPVIAALLSSPFSQSQQPPFNMTPMPTALTEDSGTKNSGIPTDENISLNVANVPNQPSEGNFYSLPRTGKVYDDTQSHSDNNELPRETNDAMSTASSSSQPAPGGVKILRQAFEDSSHRGGSTVPSIAAPHKSPSPQSQSSQPPSFVITGGKTTMIVGAPIVHHKAPAAHPTISATDPSPISSSSVQPQISPNNNSNSDNIFVSSRSGSNSNSGTPSTTPRSSLQKPLRPSDIFGGNGSAGSSGSSNNSSNQNTPRNSVGRSGNNSLAALGLSVGEVKTIRGGRPSILRTPSTESMNATNSSLQGNVVEDVLIGPGRSSNLPEELRTDMKRVDASDSHIIVGHTGQSSRGTGSGSLAKFWENLIPNDEDQPGSFVDDQPMNQDEEVY